MLAPRRANINAGLLGMASPAAFSEQSLRRLQGVNPALSGLMQEVEKRALDQGIKIEVSEGLRDPGRQAQMVAQGKSQTLNSKHIRGNALDVHIRNPDGSPNWDFEAYRPVAEIAKQVAAEKGLPGLVWGGDWKTLKDGVHFELAGADYAAPQGGGRGMIGGGAGRGAMIGQAGADALPAQEKPRGLFGFLSDPDKRARLAIALEGMTLNPNAGLIGVLQEGIKSRGDDKRINATAQWLKSRGRDDLAQAMAGGGLSAADAVRMAMAQTDPTRGVVVGNRIIDPVSGKVIYEGEANATPQSAIAKLEADRRTGLITEEQYKTALQAMAPTGYKQVTGLQLGLTGQDAQKLFNVAPNGQVTAIGGSGQTINVNAGEDKFAEAFATGDAKTLDGVYASGLQAARNIGRINQLGALLEKVPTGAQGALKLAAGEFGIATDGLSDIQAAQAMINSLVPEQRQPGSGPMSDADLALFKQSLPRIINQPGGNKTIVDTMKAIAEYDAQGAQIVQDLRAQKIDRATAFQMLQDRPNPLGSFKAAAPSPAAPATLGAQPQPGGGAVDFSTMDVRSLLNVDVTNLTPDQLRAFVKRMNEVQP